MIEWFWCRPFWCRFFGHVWYWKEGSRPFCGACMKPITIEELVKVIAEEKKLPN